MESKALLDGDPIAREIVTEVRREEALQNAIFNSAKFSSIATDGKSVIQILNVGAERMLGHVAADDAGCGGYGTKPVDTRAFPGEGREVP